MRSILLVLAILFLSQYTNAQEMQVRGNIYGADSRKKVGYASVQVLHTSNITDADENGYFEIAAGKSDSVIFSCIGFKQLILPVSRITAGDSIFLKEDFKELEPVIITKPIPQTYGIINEKQTRSHIGSSRYEMATLIEIPPTIKRYRIKRVFIKQRNFNEASPFKLHIYSIDEAGLPGEELLEQEVVAEKKDNISGIVELDISDHNIILSATSFFVGIQWLSFSKGSSGIKNEHGIAETNKEKRILTYRRTLRIANNRWYIDYDSAAIFFPRTIKSPEAGTVPAKKNPVNMLASSEIEAFLE